MKFKRNVLILLTLLCVTLIALALSSCAKKPEIFTLAYTAEEGGYVVGDSLQQVESGQDGAKISAIPAEGYIFSGWSDGEESAERQDLAVTADLSVSAKFTAIVYFDLNYTAEEGGYIVGNPSQRVESGHDGAKVSAVPAAGYAFSGWSDGEESAERQDTAVNENKNVSAKFSKFFSINFISANEVQGHIDGEAMQYVPDGGTTAEVTAVPSLGYKFKGWSDGVTDEKRTVTASEDVLLVASFEIAELSLPIICINTLNAAPILDKETYINCDVSVSNCEKSFEFAAKSGKIKGRGNSTWTHYPKKPYKLKFSDKVDLFGHGSAKTWTLIADYADKSLLRNRLAYSVGDVLGLEFNNTSQPVELYLNGEYMGEYIVCEQTETGTNRVEINDDINLNDQGFLVELDMHLLETNVEHEEVFERDWFLIDGTAYTVKGPETDDPDELSGNDPYEITAKIKEKLEAFWATVTAGDYAQIEAQLDVESFAKCYIVAELFKQNDVGYSSWYVYYNPGGKLTNGPLWDFDLSVGNANYDENSPLRPDMPWAAGNIWYKELLKHTEFKELVGKILAENRDAITAKIDQIVAEAETCEDSYLRNFQKWDILNSPVWPNPQTLHDIHTWQGHVDFVVNFLKDSLIWLVGQYPNNTP